MEIPRERMLPLLRTMLLMRRTEEMVCEMGEEFPGNFHVYIGQEATGASVISLLRPDDPIFTTHRNHAHNVARGVSPEQVLAEILGKATGPSGGKGGTFHVMSGPYQTFATAIVGGSTILATGAALAAQLLGDGRIGVAFLGDRTLNEGAVNEAFNLASIWGLPVLYVCENNFADASYSPRASNLAVPEITEVARTYGIHSEAIDATDPTVAYEAANRLVRQVREGGKPVFLEARTPRWPGNAGEDPSLTITGATDIRLAWAPLAGDPHDAWHRADPVLKLVQIVLGEEVADQKQILTLDEEVRGIAEAAVAAARAAPFPAAEAAFVDALSGSDIWPR